MRPIGAMTVRDTRSLACGFAALLVLLAVPLVSALAFAPQADAHIYWSTRSGDIGRANLDGSAVNGHFISDVAVFPSEIAVYGRHLYWVDTNRDTIGRANLDGTGVNRDFLSFPDSPLFRPHDIAFSAGYIYWANWSTSIGRAKLNGTRVNHRFIRIKGFAPGYLAVSTRHIYWTAMAFEEPNRIGRANLDGTGVRNSFIRSETSPFDIAIGGGRIYWTTPTNAIVRANLDGTGVLPRFIAPPKDHGQPGGLAVGGGRVYWTSLAHSSENPFEDTLLGWIGSANLDGRGLRWIDTGSGEESPTDVAVVAGASHHRRSS